MWCQEQSGLSASRTSQPQGGKQKKHEKNMKFWPLNSYYKRSDSKVWLAERFSEAEKAKL